MAAPSALKSSEDEDASPGPGSFLERSRRSLAQPVLAAFIAGGVAGAVSRTVVSPLERLKILFQVQSAGQNEYKGSVFKGLAKIWKEEGWRGMLRGNGTNCVRIVPYSAVQFGSYNLFKRVCLAVVAWVARSSRVRLVHRAIAGRRSLCAQTASLRRRRRHRLRHLHLSPRHRPYTVIDTVRLLCEPGPGGKDEVAGHVGDHGPHVQKRRRRPSLVSRDHTYSRRRCALCEFDFAPPPASGSMLMMTQVGLNFMTYESVRKYLTPDGEKAPSVVRRLAAGAISGAVAQTCTYPL